MGLNIKNDEVETAIRELAERTGQSLTAAVHQAVLDKLASLDDDTDRATRLERARALSAQLRSELGPYRPGFTTDDLYDDETGLPA